MDASIMDGKSNVGAVAGVGSIKNPIFLAEGSEESEHVMLISNAYDFAKQFDLETKENFILKLNIEENSLKKL